MSALDDYIAERGKWNPNHPIYLHELLKLAEALRLDAEAQLTTPNNTSNTLEVKE